MKSGNCLNLLNKSHKCNKIAAWSKNKSPTMNCRAKVVKSMFSR